MTARSTYEATAGNSAKPTTAEATKVSTNVANSLTAQESVNAVGVNAGNPTGRGVTAANDTTIKNANAALYAARLLAEMNKQVSIQAAKDTLRSTGDTAPA